MHVNFQSIKTKLMLLVLISVLPALVIILYSGLTIQQQDIERAENNVLRMVNTLDNDHDRIVGSTRQFLLMLAKLPAVRKQDAKACNRIFADLQKENTLYANIFSATAEGMVFSGARPFKPHNIKDRKYYSDVLKTGDFSAGEYVVGVTLKQPVLHFAYPVKDDAGRFQGIVVVALDLNRYGHIFNKSGLPPGSRFTISDYKNRVLYRHPDAEEHIGKVDSIEMIKSLSLHSVEGVFTGIGSDGVKCLYGYKKFYLPGNKSPYLFLRVGVTEEEALSNAKKALAINLTLLGAALFIALVLAWFLGSQLIVQRLKKLMQAAQKIGQGDLGARSGLNPRPDELGLLTKTFDEMAEKLEEKEAQRKSAEGELKESEERYRSIFNNSIEGIYQATMEGRYLTVNPAYAHMFGYESPAEMTAAMTDIGEQLYARPEDRRRMIELMNLSDGMVRDFELQLMRNDGSLFWVSINARILQNGKGHPPVIEGICIDITGRKKMEETLRESEAKYRQLVDTANEAIIVAQDGLLKFVNPMTLVLMGGHSEQELMGRPFSEFIHPDDRSVVEKNYRRRTANEEAPPRYTFRVITLDGSFKWVEINAAFIEWQGQPATLNFLTDITERKNMEGEKRSLEERLSRAEKMEALGMLAGGVAHDLNNVLGIVVGYAELALDDVDKLSPLRRNLETVMDGGLKAAAIVNDLLTLARRGVVGSDVLNLNKIIFDCQQSPEMEKLYSYHPSVEFKMDIDNDLLNMSGSSLHLSKSLYNLLSNAAEAMPKGGSVIIKTANQSLDKPIAGYENIREGDYVVLSVSDTGEGIPESDLKHIFEPFYTKKVMGRSGTGLGLAVVWGTVKDHHGYINVESQSGKGSTFTLYFPVTRKDITVKTLAAEASAYRGKGESILIVDDVREQRDLAADMLRTLNYTVTTVESGEEAVAYMKGHEVNLVVLDMIMDPGMDGLDTYKSIREIHPGQKAIIVSGYSESERVKKAESLGAGAYVRKPYIKEKLGLAVRKELDRK